MKLNSTDQAINSQQALSEEWPTDGLEVLGYCPICQSKQRKVLHTDLHDRVFFCAPGSWTMYQCGQCGSGYLDPRPSEETIFLAYKNYFTHENNKGSPSGAKWLRRIVGNGYRNRKFGTKNQPSSLFGYVLLMLMPEARKKIDASMRHMQKHPNNKTLLDFGCGNGEFLEQAKSAGWRVKGIDFDMQAVKVAQAKGLDVQHGGIDALARLKETFSFITLSHVIEHVHHPQKLLQLCYEKLEPGGRLWIETPNISAQGHSRYGQNWRGLEPPRHLSIFNTESLTQLILNNGFREIEIEQENPVIDLVFGSSEAISAGRNPMGAENTYIKNNKAEWKIFKNHAKKNHLQREFITLSAFK